MKPSENLFRGAIAALLLALPLGCGREAPVVTAPAPVGPPATQFDLSVLPPEFAAAAREMQGGMAADPAAPLTDAEAARLLTDLGLGSSVHRLTDEAARLLLNALVLVHAQTGTWVTTGIIRSGPGGLVYSWDATRTALVLRDPPHPDIELSYGHLDVAVIEGLLRPDASGAGGGGLTGRIAIRGGADLAVTERFGSDGSVLGPPSHSRRVRGWVVGAAFGRLELQATCAGRVTRYHGSASYDVQTALVEGAGERVLLHESLAQGDVIQVPNASIRRAWSEQEGFRLTRLGGRVLATPALRICTYFTRGTWGGQWVEWPASWCALGEYRAGAETVGVLALDGTPIAGENSWPAFIMTRPGGAALPATGTAPAYSLAPWLGRFSSLAN